MVWTGGTAPSLYRAAQPCQLSHGQACPGFLVELESYWGRHGALIRRRSHGASGRTTHSAGRHIRLLRAEDSPQSVLDADERDADPVELRCDLTDLVPPGAPAV